MSELPDGWIKVPLGEVNEFSGSTVNPASRPDELFELYSVPSFPTGRPERLLGSEIGSTKQTVEAGDVLISKINPRINRVWTVGPKSSEEQIASSEWIGFRSEAVKPAFANYYFRSQEFRDLLCSEVAGVGGSLTRAQPKRVAAYPLPIAPLAEQTRIADQLDTLLARVNACNDHLDAIPGILKRFRQAVLAAAVTGRLTEEWRGDFGAQKGERSDGLWSIPEVWRWAEAKNECGFITKGTTPPKEKMQSGSGQVPFIKVYNLGFTGALDFTVDPTYVDTQTHTVELKRSIVLPGDVLMNIVGPPLGKVSVVPDTHAEWNINQAIARFRPGPNLRSEFLAYCLLSAGLVDHATAQSKATAGQWNLTLEICRSLPIPVPPLEEQDEIVLRLKRYMTLADEIEARCSAFCGYTQRLAPQVLAKAFRGDLVEQDPNDEPASALLARLGSQRTASSPDKKPRSPSQPRTTRAPAEASSMTKSRQDEDVKGQPYLAGHLRRLGVPTTAQSLFKEAELPVADFYKQLAWEIAEGHVQDNRTTLEPGHATG